MNCEICKKEYKTKRGLDNHVKNVHGTSDAPIVETPVKTEDELQNELARFCKYFYDQMRKEGNTNDKARCVLLELILLRKLSDRLDKHEVTEEDRVKIDFNKFVDNEFQDGEVITNIKNAIMIYRQCGNLHSYFMADNRTLYHDFSIKTLTGIIWRLKSVELSIADDFIGNIYEENISRSSRLMGQFFTPLNLKKIALSVVKLRDNQIVADPSMGSAGFLIHVAEQAKNQNINVKLIGCEIDSNVYNIALLNLLIRADLPTDNFIKADAIREYVKPEYAECCDIIVSNPPFGGKDADNSDPIFVVKHKSLDCLFLQLYIYMLREGGQCSVVLPIGTLSTANGGFPEIRKHLMETCTLHQIYTDAIGGKFKNTGAATCILYFTKQKPKNDNIIEFYEIYGEEVKLLTKITQQEIINKNYTLNVKRYINFDINNDDRECLLMRDVYRKKTPKLVENTVTKYRQYGAGRAFPEPVNKYNYTGLNCKISKTSNGSLNNTVMLINESFYLKGDAFITESKNEKIDNYYLCVWLWCNLEYVKKCYRGTNQQHTDMEMFGEISIPVIKNTELFRKLTVDAIFNIVNIQRYRNEMLYGFTAFRKFARKSLLKNGTKMKIKDVVDFIQGPKIDIKKIEKFEFHDVKHSFRFYQSTYKKYFIDKYDYLERSVIFSKINKPTIHIGEKFSINNYSWVLRPKIKMDINYLYTWLMIDIVTIGREFMGTVQKAINMENFGELDIIVPNEDYDWRVLYEELKLHLNKIQNSKQEEKKVREHITRTLDMIDDDDINDYLEIDDLDIGNEDI